MNIWCVGRNFVEHSKELGHEVPQSPLFFLKAGSCLVQGRSIVLPSWATEIHHEIEIAFQLDGELKPNSVALALDLTERKWQTHAKSKGLPWTMSKSFKGACPMSPPRKMYEIPSDEDFLSWTFHLEVNDEVRQQGRLNEALFSPQKLIQFAKEHFPVEPGDWLLTGTPAGVGPLKKGDYLRANWGAFLEMEWEIS